MIRFRRKLSRVLARWAVRLNPDPVLSFTTTKVRDLREEYADIDWSAYSDDELGIAGRSFTPGSGTICRY